MKLSKCPACGANANNQDNCPECGLYLGPSIDIMDFDDKDESGVEEVVLPSKKVNDKTLNERTKQNINKFNLMSDIIVSICIIGCIVSLIMLVTSEEIIYLIFILASLLIAYFGPVYIQWCSLVLENLNALNNKRNK